MAETPLACLFVIFGATGDLTHRKLLPALYTLFQKGMLPETFATVAVARREKTDEEFRQDAAESIKKNVKLANQRTIAAFLENVYYFRNDFDTEQSYPEMKNFLQGLDSKHNTLGNRIFYLATMPGHFGNIVAGLKRHNFIERKDGKIYRIIIEKPFGSDIRTAVALNRQLASIFREEEIFRIDHYLGKESIQNLFALRFANRMFESVWDNENIDNVQVTVAENIGVETRGGYYDSYGALKDMVQNHLLQTVAIVAMEPPKSFETAEIKKENAKALGSIRIMRGGKDIKENVVFGQYKKGKWGMDYIYEQGVFADTRTETYVAIKLEIPNNRWKGVPFYLRTGKNLARKASEVVIYFKEPGMKVFYNQPHMKPNVLVIRLQPDEGIFLRFNAKEPGQEFKIQQVSMDFCHECLFGINTPEAYEKLMYDALLGDSTLFTRWDEVEAAWKIIDPIAGYWKNSKEKPVYYEAGTWGPNDADNIPKRHGHHWREPM